MNEIKLNFINNSIDVLNSVAVIFQKNEATSFDQLAVAWRVLNPPPGFEHPFNFALQTFVAVSDRWGNFSPQLSASPGQSFSVVSDSSGDILKRTSAASAPNEIQITNALLQGSINAHIYRDGRLLATKTNVAPGQKAVFEFEPVIWIGAVSQIEEGEIMNSAVVAQLNTEISLIGILSADIVMTGGGPGPAATPFVFTVQNIEYA